MECVDARYLPLSEFITTDICETGTIFFELIEILVELFNGCDADPRGDFF